MDQSFILIPALTPQNATSPILVRATRIWESVNKKTSQLFHTNVVLLDQEDNQIVAMVRNTQQAIFFPMIAEGKVYQISNAKVIDASKTFRVVDNNISLLLFQGTRIVPAEDTGLIPKHKFELTPLEDVEGLVNATNTLIDVIGLITHYGDLEGLPNGAKKMDIILTNERDTNMTVTLWEEKAQNFLDALHAAQGAPVFAVVCSVLAKTFAGEVALSSTDATKLYLNIDYKPLNNLRDALLEATAKSFDLLPPLANQHTSANTADNLQQLTIDEILDYNLPPGERYAHCLCLAEIVEVLQEDGWFYSCCPDCGRKAQLTRHSYYCYICAQDVQELKQSLIVRVRDHSATTTLTLFNKDVEHLINVPIAQVIAPENQADAIEFPTLLNNVIGKTCVFDIKISPYNTNLGYEKYPVLKLSTCVTAKAPTTTQCST